MKGETAMTYYSNSQIKENAIINKMATQNINITPDDKELLRNASSLHETGRRMLSRLASVIVEANKRTKLKMAFNNVENILRANPCWI